MLICISFIGAVVVTIGWSVGASYIDYIVARYRRRSEAEGRSTAYRQLAVERLFGLPWDWPGWLAFGVVALVLTWVSMLLGFWVFILASLVAIVILAVILFTDWQQLQARPAAPGAWLYGIRGEYSGYQFELNNYRLTIGRGIGNTLRLQDRAVSRQHAQIRYAQGRFYLQDLGSQLGTYLNGHRIDASVLRDGDQIAICDTVFEFRIYVRS